LPSHREIRWQDDFPLRDEVEDFSGRTRAFVISCSVTPLGYTVRAEEEGTNGMGYQFGAYSETSPYAALGRIRKKMHKELATRHIAKDSHGYSMLHDTLRGRITCGDTHDLALVVDGIPLDATDLIAMIASHEGFEFELKIKDPLV
jgi:hypothetical protein